MSEKTPLINTKNMAIGPSVKDYVFVVLWPLLLFLCSVGVLIFFVVIPPVDHVTVYSVAAILTMGLPVVPLISSLVLIGSCSKKAGKIHFWIVVAVCALMVCLTLTNDRIVTSSDVDEYCEDNSLKHCLAGMDMITDLSLGAVVVTVILGVLGAIYSQSFVQKLDIPPLPINA